MKLVKKMLITAAAGVLMLALGGCGAQMSVVSPSRQLVEGSFDFVGPIRRIESSIAGDIVITAENSNTITYTADENFVSYLDMSVSNGVLSIRSDGATVTGDMQVTINVGTAVLEHLSISGVANVTGNGTFTADAFTIRVSGVANAELDVSANDVDINLSGVGGIILSGETGSLSIVNSGVGHVDTRALIAQNATVTNSGVGSVNVYAASTLEINASGMGPVVYYGSAQPRINRSGFSSVERGD